MVSNVLRTNSSLLDTRSYLTIIHDDYKNIADRYGDDIGTRFCLTSINTENNMVIWPPADLLLTPSG